MIRRWLPILAIAFSSLSLGVSAGMVKVVADSSEQADRDIFKSRNGSVKATCAQFNDVQGVLSHLIRVSLAGPKQKNLSPKEAIQVHFIIEQFKSDLKKLAPNDCAGQLKLLQKALRGNQFDRSVPYQHSYKKHKHKKGSPGRNSP